MNQLMVQFRRAEWSNGKDEAKQADGIIVFAQRQFPHHVYPFHIVFLQLFVIRLVQRYKKIRLVRTKRIVFLNRLLIQLLSGISLLQRCSVAVQNQMMQRSKIISIFIYINIY